MTSQVSHGHYRPELRRGIGVLGNLAITLSFVTPTASVFVTAAVLVSLYGSGSFLSFVIGAVAGLALALCFAELGALFPVAGGMYALVVRVLGRMLGFVALVLFAVEVVLITSASALGAATYLAVVWPNLNSHVVGTIMIVVATVIAAFGIRLNAAVTGLFLVLELTAIGTVVGVGFANVHQSASILIDPKTLGANGVLTSVSAGSVLAGLTLALFAFEGYQMAIVFSEETRAPRRAIGRAVVGALLIAVVAEVLPVTATLLGTPSLAELVKSPAPLLDVVRVNAGSGLRTAVSLGVALAIFNAVIASILTVGRVVFSSARDRAWPDPVNRLLGSVHPRLQTPWVATLLFGAVSAIFTAVTSLAVLVTFTAVLVLALYVLIAVAAVVSRVRDCEIERPWKMPLWPLPPLAALALVGLTLSKQKLSDVGIVGAILGATLLYWLVYLRSRRDRRWLPLEPIPDVEEPPETLAVTADA